MLPKFLSLKVYNKGEKQFLLPNQPLSGNIPENKRCYPMHRNAGVMTISDIPFWKHEYDRRVELGDPKKKRFMLNEHMPFSNGSSFQ